MRAKAGFAFWNKSAHRDSAWESWRGRVVVIAKDDRVLNDEDRNRWHEVKRVLKNTYILLSIDFF